MHLSTRDIHVVLSRLKADVLMWVTQLKHRYLLWQINLRFKPTMDPFEKRMRLRAALAHRSTFAFSDEEDRCLMTVAEQTLSAYYTGNMTTPMTTTLNRRTKDQSGPGSRYQTLWRRLVTRLNVINPIRRVQKGSQFQLLA